MISFSSIRTPCVKPDVNEGLSYIVIQNDMGHAYTFCTELRGLDSDQEYPAPKAGVLPLNDPAAPYRKDFFLLKHYI